MNHLLKLLPWLARLGIAALFFYAGLVKIWDFHAHDWSTQHFFQDVLNYQLPDWSITLAGLHLTAWDTLLVLSFFLPWLEVVAAIALLLPRLRFGAALILSALTLIFITALSSAWARGLDITCGCFGHDENQGTDYPVILTRDALLLLTLLTLTWREWRNLPPAPPLNTPAPAVV